MTPAEIAHCYACNHHFTGINAVAKRSAHADAMVAVLLDGTP